MYRATDSARRGGGRCLDARSRCSCRSARRCRAPRTPRSRSASSGRRRTWPSLDLLRGIELTNETAKLARDEEFGAVFAKKGSDEAASGGVRRGVGAQRAARGAGRQGGPRRRGRRQRPRGVARSQHQRHVRRRLEGEVPVGGQGARRRRQQGRLELRRPSVSRGRGADSLARRRRRRRAGHRLQRVGARTPQADRDKLGTEVAYFLDGKIHASSFKKAGGESAEENALAASLFDGPSWPTARSPAT